MRLLSGITLLTAISSINLAAAIPPLSQNEREAQASDIISGEVLNLERTTLVISEDFSDHFYTGKLKVVSVIKSDRISDGDVINFGFRRMGQRPSGWCGPVGQNEVVQINTNITAYLTNNNDGIYRLLEPNGFDME